MDQVNKRDNRLRLIGLQMSDKMPPDIGRQPTGLVHQFLDIILPEIPLPHRIKRQNIRRRFRLGNRNEPDTRPQPTHQIQIVFDCYHPVKIVQREDTYTSGIYKSCAKTI